MRWLKTALIGIAILLVAALLLDKFRAAVFRTLALTTADPSVLGQVGTKSMKLIEVGMHNIRLDEKQVRDQYGVTVNVIKTPIDKQIKFKVPAAYVTTLSLKEGPRGPQNLGFTFWFPSGDPFRPTQIEYQEELAKYRKEVGNPAVYHLPLARDPFPARTGMETSVHFELTSYYRFDPAEQQRVIWSPVGDRLARGLPCVVDRQSDTRFEKYSIPPGVHQYDSCLLHPSNRDAFFLLRKNEYGTYRYSINCGEGTFSTHSKGGANCTMFGHRQGWGFVAWVNAKDPWPSRWDEMHDRIQEFLTKYATRVD